jgi:3-oxoacyl-[acyl-carrier protein] reductase
MSGLLEGRIAAVTAGGSGIGRARALGYAREGAHVVVFDVNVKTATQSQKAIRDAGSKAWSFELDVTDRDACRKVGSEISETIVMADCGYRSIQRKAP